jgi:hypothetical protein
MRPYAHPSGDAKDSGSPPDPWERPRLVLWVLQM